MQKNPKLLDLVRNRLRLLHKSIHTERQYIAWMTKYIAFCNRHEPDKARWRHPKEFGGHDVEAFLTHFAVEKHVAASTQNQALCALVFLYREVLGQPFDRVNAVRAKRPALMPVVFSRDEAIAVIEHLEDDAMQTMAKLLYGSGLRLMECVRLRIKAVDFQRKQILVRDGKGNKDRYTILLDNVIEPLQRQIAYAAALHDKDLARGSGSVHLPYALAEKYPHAATDLGWYWVFPSRNLSVDPRAGIKQRHHTHPTVLQKAVKDAIRKAGINKHASCHSFRQMYRESNYLGKRSEMAGVYGNRTHPGRYQRPTLDLKSRSRTSQLSTPLLRWFHFFKLDKESQAFFHH